MKKEEIYFEEGDKKIKKLEGLFKEDLDFAERMEILWNLSEKDF